MAVISSAKIILNTIVRVLPIGLYLATLLSSVFFENDMAMVLFFGQLLNDLIGLSYRFILKPKGKIECAVVKVGDLFYTMPAPYIQIVAYYCSFFVADMYYNDKFNTTKFLGLLIMLMITIWSRLDVQCKTMIDVALAFALGTTIGLVYYFMVKEYYIDEKGADGGTGRNDPELINNVFKYFNNS